MTEEKRIFSNDKGYKAYFWHSKFTESTKLVIDNDQNYEAEPFTYNDLKSTLRGCLGISVVDIIGIDKFWNEYCKPVPKKKWYVKVPHTRELYYVSEGKGSCSVTYENLLEENDCFTNSEIKKYGLEDCEKVPVDEQTY